MLRGAAALSLVFALFVQCSTGNLLTITEYASSCSAIYTFGSQSVVVIQSTVIVQPQPWTDQMANSGSPFILQVNAGSITAAKRTASTPSWLMASGNTTADKNKATHYRILNGQLFGVDGGQMSTTTGAQHQALALSNVVSAIDTTFVVKGGALNWTNSAFENGMALLFQVPRSVVDNAEVLARFTGAIDSSWSPCELIASPVMTISTSSTLNATQATSVMASSYFTTSAMLTSSSGPGGYFSRTASPSSAVSGASSSHAASSTTSPLVSSSSSSTFVSGASSGMLPVGYSSTASTSAGSSSASTGVTPVRYSSAASTTTISSSTISSALSSATGACGVGQGMCAGALCCSQFGFCGAADTYCGIGCQSAYGSCSPVPSSTSSSASVASPTSTPSCPAANGTTITDKNGIQYTVGCGSDTSNGAYGSAQAPNGFNDCFGFCDAQPMCAGFTYSSGFCYYKKGQPTYTSGGPGVVGGIRVTPLSSPSTTMPGYATSQGSATSGASPLSTVSTAGQPIGPVHPVSSASAYANMSTTASTTSVSTSVPVSITSLSTTSSTSTSVIASTLSSSTPPLISISVGPGGPSSYSSTIVSSTSSSSVPATSSPASTSSSTIAGYTTSSSASSSTSSSSTAGYSSPSATSSSTASSSSIRSASPTSSSSSSPMSSSSITSSSASLSTARSSSSSTSLPSSTLTSSAPALTSAYSSSSSSAPALTSAYTSSSRSVISTSTSSSAAQATYACPANDGQTVDDTQGMSYQLECFSDTSGGTCDTLQATSLNDCFALCDNSIACAGGCTSWTFSGGVNAAGPGNCYLKNFAPPAFQGTSNNGVAGAIRIMGFSSVTTSSSSSSSASLSSTAIVSTTTSASSTTSAISSTTSKSSPSSIVGYSTTSTSTSSTRTTSSATSITPTAASITASSSTSSATSASAYSSSSTRSSSSTTTTATSRPSSSPIITSMSSSSSSSTTTSSSTSSTISTTRYLTLASPTPCNFGDPLNQDEDDSWCEIDLPFTMQMYTQSDTHTFVSSNGFLSITNASSQYQTGAIPSTHIPNDTVAAYWDDLYIVGNYQYPTQGIFYQINAGRTGVTYEWYVSRPGEPNAITHFTVAYDSTAPGIYRTTYYATNGTGSQQNGGTASVGIQGLSATGSQIGFQYSLNNADISQGLSVRCNTLNNQCLTVVGV